MDEDDLLVADRIAQEVGRLIRIFTFLRRQHGDIAVTHVLVQLIEQGPKRVSSIADAAGIDQSTVSRKAAELVSAGLVERRPDPLDGRAHLLAVTPAGAQLCEHGRLKRNELVASVLAGWTVESRRHLADLLGRFADDIQDVGRRGSRRPGGEN
jgi:DNA-binding MarR family transcriptional regulator